MSHKRIIELANEISAEHDAKKLIVLLDELCDLLADEIRDMEARIGKNAA